jgi:hypothetical protein
MTTNPLSLSDEDFLNTVPEEHVAETVESKESVENTSDTEKVEDTVAEDTNEKSELEINLEVKSEEIKELTNLGAKGVIAKPFKMGTLAGQIIEIWGKN